MSGMALVLCLQCSVLFYPQWAMSVSLSVCLFLFLFKVVRVCVCLRVRERKSCCWGVRMVIDRLSHRYHRHFLTSYPLLRFFTFFFFFLLAAWRPAAYWRTYVAYVFLNFISRPDKRENFLTTWPGPGLQHFSSRRPLRRSRSLGRHYSSFPPPTRTLLLVSSHWGIILLFSHRATERPTDERMADGGREEIQAPREENCF